MQIHCYHLINAFNKKVKDQDGQMLIFQKGLKSIILFTWVDTLLSLNWTSSPFYLDNNVLWKLTRNTQRIVANLPALHNIVAMSFAGIAPLFRILLCLEYGKYGTTPKNTKNWLCMKSFKPANWKENSDMVQWNGEDEETKFDMNEANIWVLTHLRLG